MYKSRLVKRPRALAIAALALVGAVVCAYAGEFPLKLSVVFALGACAGVFAGRGLTWKPGGAPPYEGARAAEGACRIVYAQQPLEKSIFLAGPSPRKPAPGAEPVPSWRPAGCVILQELDFRGLVLVPELESLSAPDDYDAQIPWEWEGLNMGTVVVFWVARDLKNLPGYTTNVEFGLLVSSGKVVLGYPKGTPKTAYFDQLAKRYNIKVHHTLQETLAEAVRRTRLPFGQYGE